MRVASNPPDSARVQIFARPRRADLETLGRYVALPDGAFGALLVDLGTLGEIPVLDRRGIGRAVEFVSPKIANVSFDAGAHTLRLDPHAIRSVRADLTAALRAQGLKPRVVAHQDATAMVRAGPRTSLPPVTIDGVWLVVGREVRSLSFCAGGQCRGRAGVDLERVANPHSSTLEEVANADVGSVLVDARRAVAWRKVAPGKKWVPQRPSASSPDGWASRLDAPDSSLVVWRQIVATMAREPLYLLRGATSRPNPPRREAWQMPLEEFLGDPRRSRVDRREIKPWYSDEARRAADEPFMGGKYRIRRGVDEHGRPLYTVLDGELPVASYDGYQLLVAREYRRRGIATELVADLRERHPEVPPATARTEPAERVQRRAHKLILWRAVLDGKPVPPAAMRGYPDLSRLMLRVRKNGTSRSEKIRERTAAYSLYGVIHPDPVSAFNDIAFPFFDTGYWDALGLDEDRDSSDEARIVIADSWEMLGGRVKGRVFAWHTLDIRAEDRGRGLGRSIVEKMERSLRDMGVSGIILQAGQLDESRHSLPFWEKLGYEEWPLEYGIYDDRVVFKVLQPPGVRINGAERMATFVVDVHDDPDEQGVWQRFWVYARDAENRYSLGMVMAARRGDHVAGKCRDDRDELRRASGVPRMPVFHVESSFVSDQHRATGIGVSLYAEAARVARTRFGAMLVAGDCKHTDETSASAARVWASRRLAEDPRLMVRGHCMMWIGGPQ